MNKFGIVGYGIIGKATQIGLLNQADVIIHDPIFNTSLSDIQACSVVFFCIPTSTQHDIEVLTQTIIDVKLQNPNTTIVIRSTVPLQSCKKIQDTVGDKIFYIPEFLRERYWDTDCTKEVVIVGHEDNIAPTWLTDKLVRTCSLEEAELLKMFHNNYAAMRVVYANHFYNLAEAVDADYDKVLSMYFHTEHDQSYLDVNDNLRGFGGKCLPKDLDFLIASCNELSVTQTLFDSVKRDNLLWPTHVKKS